MANEERVAAYQAGDIGGLEEVFRNVEGLIRHQAKKLCRNDSLLEDLLQEGRAAVMEATKKFDLRRGTLFTTYALPLIRAAMVEYLAKADSPVSLP
jgi:RNA polymerase sigma factor (sigma-70 family)